MRRLARRRFVSLLAGLGAASMLPARAQSEAYAEALGKLTGGAAVGSGRVTITTPRLADNGHSVPFEVSVASPMTATDYVKTVSILSPRNPRALIATFHLGAHAGRARIATRVRLNGTQAVLAVAQLSDGSFWSGTAEVEVTESACLDMS